MSLHTHNGRDLDSPKEGSSPFLIDSLLAKDESVSLYRSRYKNLEAQFREKDRIISLVSHHIRGPLASTQGISSLIETYIKEEKCDKVLDIVAHLENSFRDLLKLTDHLLTWSASDSHELKLKPEACRIETQITDSLAALDFPIQLNELKVNLQIKDSDSILMDPRVLRTVVHYLVDNAVKFSPQKGEISITLDKRGPDITLKIVNQGDGFPEKLIERPFQYHRDLIQKGSNGEEGVGLGLISVWNYLSRSGGLLKISNLENGNSCIEALFPRAFA